MVNPLPHPGADLSPTSILTTPGVMSLDLSPPPPAKEARRWDFNFQMLLQFRDREGHLRVPARHVEDGHKLGSWICTQRTRKRLGTLCPERLHYRMKRRRSCSGLCYFGPRSVSSVPDLCHAVMGKKRHNPTAYCVFSCRTYRSLTE
jgi:hypothetical protein